MSGTNCTLFFTAGFQTITLMMVKKMSEDQTCRVFDISLHRFIHTRLVLVSENWTLNNKSGLQTIPVFGHLLYSEMPKSGRSDIQISDRNFIFKPRPFDK